MPASLAHAEDEELRLLLLGDAASCAKSGPRVPAGFYARGIEEGELVDGVHRSSMEELTAWTQWADQVLVF